MRLYEIKISELGLHVKFKALTQTQVDDFNMSLGEVPHSDFVHAVINHFVYNVNTDVKTKLKLMSPAAGKSALQALYHGCIFLNPGLDPDRWVTLAYSNDYEARLEGTRSKKLATTETAADPSKKKSRTISRAKILALRDHLHDHVIGQDEAIDVVFNALKRSLTGLSDVEKPLGVFLFAGSSGVGKTYLAKMLHNHLFSVKDGIARIDCGEFQEKHQAITLLGAPPSYVGYDAEKGGVLAQIIEKNPQTVLLVDEVEKADPSLWNLFLRICDEGKVTDSRGVTLDFRKTIIIMTTNLGNEEIVKKLTGKSAGFGARINTLHDTDELPDHTFVVEKTLDAIKRYFKPEFLNRLDSTIVFKHLQKSEYKKIARLELTNTTRKLASKGFRVVFEDSAIEGLVQEGVDTIRGARGMAGIRRDRVENLMADLILDYNLKKGATFHVSFDKDFDVSVSSGKSEKRVNNA